MSKVSVAMRQEKRKKTVAKHAKKRLYLKKRSVDMNLPVEVRIKAMRDLQKLPRDASPVRLRSRCHRTQRPRGVYWLGLCRHEIRRLAMEGLLSGVWKSSW